MGESRVKQLMLCCACLAALAIGVAGCNTKGTYPVEGKVVYDDGTPAVELAGYTVSMDSSEHNVGANGVVQADGTFRIGTYDNDDGALPGTYRVSLSPPTPPIDQPAPKPIIDGKYGHMDKSGLTANIKAERNVVELKVERLKK